MKIANINAKSRLLDSGGRIWRAITHGLSSKLDENNLYIKRTALSLHTCKMLCARRALKIVEPLELT